MWLLSILVILSISPYLATLLCKKGSNQYQPRTFAVVGFELSNLDIAYLIFITSSVCYKGKHISFKINLCFALHGHTAMIYYDYPTAILFEIDKVEYFISFYTHVIYLPMFMSSRIAIGSF
jgi:hypothetical protein